MSESFDPIAVKRGCLLELSGKEIMCEHGRTFPRVGAVIYKREVTSPFGNSIEIENMREEGDSGERLPKIGSILLLIDPYTN